MAYIEATVRVRILNTREAVTNLRHAKAILERELEIFSHNTLDLEFSDVALTEKTEVDLPPQAESNAENRGLAADCFDILYQANRRARDARWEGLP